MLRSFVLPLLAVAGFSFAVYTVMSSARPVPVAQAAAEPARAPFARTIAGAGIVEARSQNIAIGTSIGGVVTEVLVAVGARVKAGDALFRIDDREALAELEVRRSAHASARAELERLESQPRPENLPPAQAHLDAAEADLADARSQLELAESLSDKRAMATEEWTRRRFAAQSALARASQARAEYALLKAGAWKADIEVARAAVAGAQARVAAQETELARLWVRAPAPLTVLQVNVRAGEYAASGAIGVPLMVAGDIDMLHVRVDIDENDAWRFKPGAKATAFVRGNSELSTPIEFVRVDPYVVPKRSLTGESTERVDTRVLQVLYRFDPKALPVYVGQQMDVFIEVSP